jgi:hypothetical protein
MFDFRKKHGVTRNDFLDSMIELRNKGKKVFQEEKISTDGGGNSNFRKLRDFRVSKWVKSYTTTRNLANKLQSLLT